MSKYTYFRRRVFGPRCASPPTFICYELPQPEPYSRSASSDDDGVSGSEDDETGDEYSGSESTSNRSESSAGEPVERMKATAPIGDAWEVVDASQAPAITPLASATVEVEPHNIPCPASGSENENESSSEYSERLRAEKREGKKKEVVAAAMDEGVDKQSNTSNERKKKEKKRRTRKRHAEEYTPVYRPILTVRTSQGFVWNQDLFLSSYDKDRYIASSPPSSFVPMGSSSPGSKSRMVNNNFFSTSDQMDYEVECVEIHVEESELGRLIPSS